MTPAAILKAVKKAFPELKNLTQAERKLVEKALIYACTVASRDDLVSDEEHAELMNEIGYGGKPTPGRSLRAYRYRQDLTQAALAKKTGIPQANISAMENGRRPIGLSTAKKIAAVLNCDYRGLI